jgi:dienelactone hydrolase
VPFIHVCLIWSLGAADFGDLRNLTAAHTKTHFAPPLYRSAEEWEVRKRQLRRQILASAGLWPVPERPPLSTQRFGRLDRGTYVIEKVLLETLPGYYLGGNLYSPKRTRRRTPGVLVPHGHWKGGRVENTDVYSVPALCANLAVQGYVAFTYDMVGYNDTRQTPHKFGDSAAEQLWSFSPLGLQLWNSIRALDFLESLPAVDGSRLAVTGASGGGTQTILLTAVDDRIKVSAPVVMVSASFQGDDVCEMAPGLRVGTNNVEIAAMMAPRPMLLVSSTRDWTRNTPKEEFPAIQAIYRLYGRPERVAYAQIDAEHNYNGASRKAVYEFFARHLQGDGFHVPVAETEAADLRPEDLLIGPGVLSTSQDLLTTQDQVFAAWQETTRRQIAALSDQQLRQAFGTILGIEWPTRVVPLHAGEWILLERAGHGERIPVEWLPGAGRESVLLIAPEGSTAARESAVAQNAIRRGDSVLFLNVYQTGSAKGPRISSGRDFLTFHRSDDANRVQDILVGLAFLSSTEPHRVRLVCAGSAGGWCLLAAALAPIHVTLDADRTFTGSDEELKKELFIPGLQRAGGLAAALRLLGHRSELQPLEKPEAALSPVGVWTGMGLSK